MTWSYEQTPNTDSYYGNNNNDNQIWGVKANRNGYKILLKNSDDNKNSNTTNDNNGTINRKRKLDKYSLIVVAAHSIVTVVVVVVVVDLVAIKLNSKCIKNMTQRISENLIIK